MGFAAPTATVRDSMLMIHSWVGRADFFSFSGGPGEGKLFLPEEPDPLHHPPGTRKYLPHYLCFLHKVWKKSLGENLLSGWVPVGGPPEEGKPEMRGQCSGWPVSFPKSGFNPLSFKVTRAGGQLLFFSLRFPSKCSIDISNSIARQRESLCNPPNSKS